MSSKTSTAARPKSRSALKSERIWQRRSSMVRRRSRVLDEILNATTPSSPSRVRAASAASPNKSNARPKFSQTAPMRKFKPDELDALVAGSDEADDSLFPSWMKQRGDFDTLIKSSINNVVARRTVAEQFLKFECGIDANQDRRYFQGPQRAFQLRRNAVTTLATKSGQPIRVIDRDDTTTKHRLKQPESKQDDSAGDDWTGALVEPEEEPEQRVIPQRASRGFHALLNAHSDADFSEAERHIQRAFVIRARTFGLDNPATKRARTNLLKCYMAQSKTEEARDVRDNIAGHLAVLERSLSGHDEKLRKGNVRKRFQHAVRGAAMTSLLTRSHQAKTSRVQETRSAQNSSNETSRAASPSTEVFDENAVIADDPFVKSSRVEGQYGWKGGHAAIAGQRRTGVSTALVASKYRAAAELVPAPQELFTPIHSGSRSAKARPTTSASTPNLPRLKHQNSDLGTLSVSRPGTPGSPMAGSKHRGSTSGLHVSRGDGSAAGSPSRGSGPPGTVGGTSDSEGDDGAALGVSLADREARLVGSLQHYDNESAQNKRGLRGSKVSSDRPEASRAGAPMPRLKREVLSAISVADFGHAADLSRQALSKDASDPALNAMFRASLGKLSEYPRAVDFRAAVELSCQTSTIIGESLDVGYSYLHLDDPDRMHPQLDWIGIFKLNNVMGNGGGGGGLAGLASFVTPKKSHTSGAANTMLRNLRARSGSRPGSAAATQRSLGLTHRSGMSKQDTTGGVPLSTESTIDFGDGPADADESLIGWSLVPARNSGVVQFKTIPSAPGQYRVRYFIQGSQCQVGEAVDVTARNVVCSLQVPTRVLCGDPLRVQFELHYTKEVHGPDDWAGLFVLDKKKSHWRKIQGALAVGGANTAKGASGIGPDGRAPPPKTPYDSTKPVERRSLPPDNTGSLFFVRHPVYPGRYQVRVFTKQVGQPGEGDHDAMVAASPIITATTHYFPYYRYTRLHRELRIYLATSYSGVHIERSTIMSAALPKLREFCEERAVSVMLVDLRIDVEADKGFDLPDAAELALQEIEACRPHVFALLGANYGWVPPQLGEWLVHEFPWLRHHTNPELPTTKAKGLFGLLRGRIANGNSNRRALSNMHTLITAETPMGSPPGTVQAGSTATSAHQTPRTQQSQPVMSPIASSKATPRGEYGASMNAVNSLQPASCAGLALNIDLTVQVPGAISNPFEINVTHGTTGMVPIGKWGWTDAPQRCQRICQDLHDSLSKSSQLELEMFAAFGAPGLQANMIRPQQTDAVLGMGTSLRDELAAFDQLLGLTQLAATAKQQEQAALWGGGGAFGSLNEIGGGGGSLIKRVLARSKSVRKSQRRSYSPGMDSMLSDGTSLSPLGRPHSYASAATDLEEDTDGRDPLQRTLEQERVKRIGWLESATARLLRHCVVYTRHPTLITPPIPSALADKFLPEARPAELALLHLRNASSRRGDQQRIGYSSANELVDWLLADVASSLQRNFPSRETPAESELWSIAAQAFAASRLYMYATSSKLDSLLEQITDVVTSTALQNRPMVIVGAQGSGKSALIARWVAKFKSDLLPSAQARASRSAAGVVSMFARNGSSGKLSLGQESTTLSNAAGKLTADGEQVDKDVDKRLRTRLGSFAHINSSVASRWDDSKALPNSPAIGSPVGTSPIAASSSATALPADATGTVPHDPADPNLPASLHMYGEPGSYRLQFNIAGSAYVGLALHLGAECGIPSATSLMLLIARELTYLTAGACADAATTFRRVVLGTGTDTQLKHYFAKVLRAAASAYRIVLVLDGLDWLEDGSRQGRRPVGMDVREGAYNPAVAHNASHAPLWWFPTEYIERVHMVITLRRPGPAWDAVNGRGWGRMTVKLPRLPTKSMYAIWDQVLGRAAPCPEWSAQHGLIFKYCLQHSCPAIQGASAAIDEEVALLHHYRTLVEGKGIHSSGGADAAGGAGKTAAGSDAKGGGSGETGGIPPLGKEDAEAYQALRARLIPDESDTMWRVAMKVVGALLDNNDLQVLGEYESLTNAQSTRGTARTAASSSSTSGGNDAEKIHLVQLRNPLTARYMLAYLCLAADPFEVLTMMYAARCVPTHGALLHRLMDFCEERYPLAIDALCFLALANKGLQEVELTDMMQGVTGSTAPDTLESPHARPLSIAHVPNSAARVDPLVSTGRSRPRSSASTRGRSRGPSTAPSAAGSDHPMCPPHGVTRHASAARHRALGKSGAPFDMRNWCRARRVLLSFALVRSRGLMILEGDTLRKVVAQRFLLRRKDRAPWLQRMAAYFWMRPPGLRKAEELTPALVKMQLLGFQADAEAAGMIPAEPAAPRARRNSIRSIPATPNATSGGATAAAGANASVSMRRAPSPGTSGKRGSVVPSMAGLSLEGITAAGMASGARNSEVHQQLARRPSFALAAGATPFAAFPFDSRQVAARMMIALVDTRFLIYADKTGGEVRQQVVDAILFSGKPLTQVSASVRAAFEALHGISGFARAPAYHLLRGAMIDPFNKKVPLSPGRRGPEASRSTLKRTAGRGGHGDEDEPDTRSAKQKGGSKYITITREDWADIRKRGPQQLLHLASILRSLGRYTGAQSLLEASVFMNLNLKSYDAAGIWANRVLSVLKAMFRDLFHRQQEEDALGPGHGDEGENTGPQRTLTAYGGVIGGHIAWVVPPERAAAAGAAPGNILANTGAGGGKHLNATGSNTTRQAAEEYAKQQAEEAARELRQNEALRRRALETAKRSPTIADVEALVCGIGALMELYSERFIAVLRLEGLVVDSVSVAAAAGKAPADMNMTTAAAVAAADKLTAPAATDGDRNRDPYLPRNGSIADCDSETLRTNIIALWSLVPPIAFLVGKTHPGIVQCNTAHAACVPWLKPAMAATRRNTLRRTIGRR